MKPLRLLTFALLLVVLSSIASADQLAFNGNVLSGESLTIDKQVIIIYLSTSENGIVAEYGGKTAEIANNSCFYDDYFNVCLDNIVLDTALRKKKIYIRAYSSIPSFTITRTASKSEVFIGEETKFTVSVSNSGGIARNSVFAEEFPEEIEIVEATGAKIKGNSIYWEGEIKSLGSRDFEYTVKPKNEVKRGLKASFKYFDGYGDKAVYSSEITLNAIQPLKLETSIGRESAYLGETNNFTVNVTNRWNNTLNVTLDVRFSQNLSVNPPSLFSKTAHNQFSWTLDALKRNLSNTRFFSRWQMFTFKGLNEGTYEVSVSARFNDPATGLEIKMPETKKFVKVSDKGVAIRSNLNDKIIDSGQQYQLKVYVQNLNPFAAISDVKISTATGFGYIPDYALDSIEAGKQELVVDKKYYAPIVLTTTGVPLYVNVTYKSGSDTHTKSHKDSISVVPVKDLVIKHATSKDTVYSGEDLFMTVSVQNQRKTGINNVLVKDKIPPELAVFGAASATVDIGKDSTIAAYTYRIKAPRVSQETSFKISTTASYTDIYNEHDFSSYGNYSYTKEAAIKVLPAKFSLSLSKRMKDSEFYKGLMHDVDYTIKNENDDEQIVQNGVLMFPLQPEIDFVDRYNYSISPIDPGETVYVSSKEKLRFKVNGTLTLLKSSIGFDNQHGDHFLFNSSDIALTVKSGALTGPAIIMAKAAPEKANNTDVISIQLAVRNIGNSQGDVTVSDNGKSFSSLIKPGEEVYFNYTTVLALPGMIELQPAVAYYSADSRNLITGSNRPKVEVTNKPLLKLEKIAPETAGNLRPFNVTLRLKALSDFPVDVALIDGNNTWQFSGFSGTRDVPSQAQADENGKLLLPPAIALYSYMNASYSVSSNPASVEIADEVSFFISKSASKAAAYSGENVKVMLYLKNSLPSSIKVEVKDSGKDWNVSLSAGEEKKIEYDLKASPSLGQATAEFTFRGKQYSFSSEDAKIEIMAPKVAQPPEEKGIIKKIIKAIKQMIGRPK